MLYFSDVSDVLLQSIFKLNDNGKVQSHDKEESKLNSTIIANSGAHTLTND